MLKTCTQCHLEKPATLDFFQKDPKQSSGLRPNCKKCISVYAKRNYLKNREEKIAKTKAYAEKNASSIKEKKRIAYALKIANDDGSFAKKKAAYHQRTKHIAYQRMRKRMLVDPQFRASTNLGARFRQFVKNKPQGGFQEIVGYRYKELYDHIAKQFDDTMSWDNYGTVWEIDHIRPVSSFDLPAEAARCWALRNLRPLACSENKRKSNRIIFELISSI